MARNGSGTYSLPESAFVYDTTIDETAVNNNFSDIATALTGSMAKDGQTTASARIPFAQGIGLADGSAAAPAVNFTGDTDTGFYRIGVNNLGISIAGAKAWEWKADGDLESNGKNLNGVAAADFSGAVTFTGSIVATNATVTGMTVADDQFTIADEGDATKKIAFQASGVTTGTTRTFTAPDASGTLALLGGAQTFDGDKTFTGAVDLSGGTTTFAANSVSLGTIATIAQSTMLGRAAGAGTGDVTALSVAQIKAILGITDPFTSTAITASTLATGDQTYSAAHGFGAAPFDAFAVLKCTTTDLGYSVGESVILRDNITKLSSSSVWSGFWVGFDATNVYGHQEANLAIPNRSTGLISPITYSSWELYLCAVPA